ncbi:MAG: quinone-dependent dihydroorotate dehydrogenase [Bacteroidales bacterium]|jgi:dihydroorotate dehydrogenase|nr:quinone-dependent dihydroorotate dehydrogenase [Bacteroidales bacterium]
MSVYTQIIRPVLFRFNPEGVHNFTIGYLSVLSKCSLSRWIVSQAYSVPKNESLSRTVFGIKFPHPVGLAAGLDKNAQAYAMFGAMGFSFVEIGTVTPLAQPGNDKPRLFRLPKDKAIVNRMGFNNKGLGYAVSQLRKKNTKIIVGGNIGKNKVTPNEDAVSDYITCFETLYDYVDYFTVNVSSPNTPNLRELQDKEPLTHILSTLMEHNNSKATPKPILLKIAPDVSHNQLDDIVDIVKSTGIAGIVATNTTIIRDNLPHYSQEYVESLGAGGLSGAPEKDVSTEVIRYIHQKSQGTIPIIGVGGIMTPDDAQEKLDAGASLVQLYTGFIYEGPVLIQKICRHLLHHS